MAEVRWRSYFLSVGVILPLTAVLSAAWMEVDPVSWKQWKAHSSGGTVNPYDNKEDPSKPRFASPLHKPSASLWWLDSTQLAVWRRQSIQRKDSADLLCWVNRLHPCYKENRQLTHTPSTTQENSQASLNGWKKKKQTVFMGNKFLKGIPSHSLPTLLQQFRLLSEAGTRNSFPQFIRQAPLEARTQGIPTLWHIWAKENRTPEPDTEHLISYLCSLCQGSCGSLFIKLRRHMAYNKLHGEGCPCLGSLFSATLNLSLPRSSARYVFFYFI